MNEIVIKCIRENDKLILTGFILTTINIYIISKILRDHEERIYKLEKGNNKDISKGE